MTPLDYGLWLYFKTEVCQTKPNRLDESIARILDAATHIQQSVLRKTICSLRKQVGKCTDIQGLTFKQLSFRHIFVFEVSNCTVQFFVNLVHWEFEEF